MANPFVHLELNAPDLKKAQAFYSGMFGWKFDDMDMGPMGIYSTFKPDSGPGGGAYSAKEMPQGWLASLFVNKRRRRTCLKRLLSGMPLRPRNSPETAPV